MVGTSKAVDATVFATPIWVDTGRKPDVRAVVVVNDRSRVVLEQDGLPRRIIRLIIVRRFVSQRLKPIRGIACGPSTSQLFSTHDTHYNSAS